MSDLPSGPFCYNIQRDSVSKYDIFRLDKILVFVHSMALGSLEKTAFRVLLCRFWTLSNQKLMSWSGSALSVPVIIFSNNLSSL